MVLSPALLLSSRKDPVRPCDTFGDISTVSSTFTENLVCAEALWGWACREALEMHLKGLDWTESICACEMSGCTGCRGRGGPPGQTAEQKGLQM